MFKPNYGICICHSKKRLIVVKSGHCKQGNDERKGKSKLPNKSSSNASARVEALYVKPKKKKVLNSRKCTGERKIFEEILQARGPYSQVSGQYLGEGFNPWWFSHVVPKSIAPKLRLDPRNIILKTPEEHTLWENHKHKIRHIPEWKWVFELEEQLKQEYNQKQK